VGAVTARVGDHPSIATEGVLRPTHVQVDLGALRRNHRRIAEHVAPALVMPILKANAYGHGLVEVAGAFDRMGVPYLGVAYLEEGILLRRSGVTAPILVLGGIVGTQVPLFFAHDLTITVPSTEKLKQVEEAAAAAATRARVHLKIDTGMERIGTHWYTAERLLDETLRCSHLDVEGIYSHLANSDAADLADARRQLDRFAEVLSWYDRRSLPAPLRHLANSGAILQLPEAHLDLVRPGILSYGIYPSAEARRTVVVEPVLSWTTQVVYFKVVEADHPVSYGSTWRSDHQVRVVTIPVGYGDGYSRLMSGRAQVLIRGRRYPVVGRICMDQSMINIEWDTSYNGDLVTLIGRDGDEVVGADDLAEWMGTIAYEILTNISARVPRVYV
jgi:alanine racemase